MTHFAVTIALFAKFLWSLRISPTSSLRFSYTAHARLLHTWANYMLDTFVNGADDRQCHKTPIVTVIVGTKRFKKAVHCSETGGLPTWKNFRLLQPVSSHPQKDNLTLSTVGSY